VGQQGHYPFGESWYATSTTTKWQFTSYERDSESTLDYALLRYQCSRLGRFMTPDRVAGSNANPQSLNRYAYVGNNPVNFVDPLGLRRSHFDEEEGPGMDCTLITYRDYDFQWEAEFYNSVEVCTISRSSGGSGGGGGRRTPGQKKIAAVVNQALQQPGLSDCLNKWIASGTVLTNENLPFVDASKDLPGATAGQTVHDQVPATGRGTVQIDRGFFAGLPADDPFLVATYLHELANVLAIQTFINVPKSERTRRGARGGPPTQHQLRSFDKDIGQQFEECLFKKE
jgi:RHS repeat-associated protein